MKGLIGLLIGLFVLSLSSLATTIVISSTGSGHNEIEAIAVAKKQAISDAESAGLKASQGYRVSSTKVVELYRSDSAYVARIDAVVAHDITTKRVLLLIDGAESELPSLYAVTERVRDLLSRRGSQDSSQIVLTDSLASGLLSIGSLSELQDPRINSVVENMGRAHSANAVYLLKSDPNFSLVLLVQLINDKDTERTVQKLNANSTNRITSLSEQIASTLIRDFKDSSDWSNLQSVITISTGGTKVQKGQRVIIYATNTGSSGIDETTILANGVITETFGSKVRVLTELPVSIFPETKLRISPLVNRGIIKESDW